MSFPQIQMRRQRILAATAGAMLAVCAGGCTVGPNYHRPDAPTPSGWKSEGPWRPGEPRDTIPKGVWWETFTDADLNALETQAMSANQTLQGAIARLDQARAQANLSLSPLYPQLSVGASVMRQRLAANRPLSGGFAINPTSVSQNTFEVPFVVAYEPDFFGRVRRNVESARATLQASTADLENVRLLVASELAGDYFTLRQLDEEIGVLDRTVASFEKGLQLVEDRQKGGVASGLDVAEEQTLLDSTRTTAILLRQQRAQFEDAIATLAGQPASSFHVDAKPMPSKLPAVPTGVPSDILERRPDVAEAERQMAAANAQIGVAKSAYYPTVALGTGITNPTGFGLEATSLAKLFTVASSFWAVGANVAQDILTGGARRAQVQFAQAGYNGAVANYRGTVLTAFQETEDNLAALAVLDQAQRTQAQAVEDARRALTLATNRYTGGLVSYLDVITAQQTLLSNERLAVQLEGQRLVSSVQLIKALGGGWDAASLAAIQVKPSVKQAFTP